MAKFTMSEHIDARPDIVFELASDFHRAAQHIRGIERIEVLTDGPIGVGTRFRETRVMFGKESTEQLEITQFDAPHSYTVECDSCGCHYHVEYRFIADISGTHVRLEFSTTPISLMAKIMSPLTKLMMGPMKKCIAGDLEDIRQVAEAKARQHEDG